MNKIDILKTLESKGALKYPELRALSGFGRRENGWLFENLKFLSINQKEPIQ